MASKRQDANAKALEVMRLIGVPEEQLVVELPASGTLVGNPDKPFDLIVPPGMEMLRDLEAGDVRRAANEKQAQAMEARGFRRINDPRVHFRGMARGKGIYLFRPRALGIVAEQQRKEIVRRKRPVVTRTRRGVDNIPLPHQRGEAVGVVEETWSPATVSPAA